MVMQASLAEAAIEQQPFAFPGDTLPADSGLSSDGSGQEAPTPESTPEGAPAATPPPDFVSKADFEAVKKQADELAAWRTEQQQREQAAQQQQAGTELQARLASIQKWGKTYGLSDDDGKMLTDMATAYLGQQTPQFRQSVATHIQYVHDLEAKAARADSYDLVFGKDSDPLSGFPPNTTLSSLRKHFAEISKWPDKERREWFATQLRNQQYQQNNRGQQETGAEVTERGGGGGGFGGMSFDVLERKFGNNTATAAEEQRYIEMRSQRRAAGQMV